MGLSRLVLSIGLCGLLSCATANKKIADGSNFGLNGRWLHSYDECESGGLTKRGQSANEAYVQGRSRQELIINGESISGGLKVYKQGNSGPGCYIDIAQTWEIQPGKFKVKQLELKTRAEDGGKCNASTKPTLSNQWNTYSVSQDALKIKLASIIEYTTAETAALNQFCADGTNVVTVFKRLND